ncbi:hypothetical protein JCM10212_003416 [Sporobolomyces blumeae]
MGQRRYSSDDASYLTDTDPSDLDEDDDDRLVASQQPKPLPPRQHPSTFSPAFLLGMFAVILVVVLGIVFVLYRRVEDLSDSLDSAASSRPVATSTPGTAAASQTASKTSSAVSRPSSTSGNGEEGEGDGEESDDDDLEPSATRPGGPNTASPTNTGSPGSSGGSSASPPLYGTLSVDFGSLDSADGLEAFLSENKLAISDYPVGSTPVTHSFLKENVDWVDGALRLIVTGQSGNGDVKSGEIATTEDFLYGTVTTRLKASPVPGVCHGIFWYTNDNLEVDIELLSSYYTEGRGDSVKPGLQLTNQALTKGDKSSNTVVPYGFDPTADFHDYTIEWTEDATIFSVDGTEVGRLTDNVPKEKMAFIWNNWSSGEPNWSAGPPTEDSYMLISYIAANWTVA